MTRPRCDFYSKTMKSRYIKGMVITENVWEIIAIDDPVLEGAVVRNSESPLFGD